jgi:hypothetical protein
LASREAYARKTPPAAGVVKLVDALDSKSSSERSVGSIPTTRTTSDILNSAVRRSNHCPPTTCAPHFLAGFGIRLAGFGASGAIKQTPAMKT